LPKTPKLKEVCPLMYVRTIGEPAKIEHDSPLLFAVAQFVFGEPGPGGQTMLNTRLVCAAKVRKLLASAAEGAVKVRSLLFTYIPSPTASGPPKNDKVVFVVTSELHPLPSVVVHPAPGSGSILKIILGSDIVIVPVDPVSKVLTTLAEASETKSKPPARTAAGAKANHKVRNVICHLVSNVRESGRVKLEIPVTAYPHYEQLPCHSVSFSKVPCLCHFAMLSWAGRLVRERL